MRVGAQGTDQTVNAIERPGSLATARSTYGDTAARAYPFAFISSRRHKTKGTNAATLREYAS